MKHTYVTALLTEDFLPGVLVLNESLHNVKSNYNLLVLITPNVKKSVIEILNEAEIEVKLIDIIKNPNKKFRFKRNVHLYSKLRIFNLTQYSKVVYLDADTFVCTNIDNLFSEPHMSAVNSGGMLPELSDWVDLNSGVLVIEPNKSLFEDFMQKMEYLPSKGGGDQGFLQSYYPNWPEQEELHLCHGYNMFVGHVRFYKKLFGYRFANQIKEFDEKVIRILHFWADFKPWVFENFSGIQGDERIVCNLWFKTANQMMEKLSLKTSKKLGKHFPNLSRIKEILHESNGV